MLHFNRGVVRGEGHITRLEVFGIFAKDTESKKAMM